MLHGAIFDMDGVLVDNMKIHMKAFTEITRRYGVTFDPARVMSMNGMGNAEFFSALFPRKIIERAGGVDALADEKEALYREMYAPLLTPARGLIDFLDDLKASGVKIALGTSAPRANMDFVLDGLDIRRYFDAVVNADMVTRTKPDPEIYLVALRELGLQGKECLVFEDAIAGIKAADGAGIKAVGLATSENKDTIEGTPDVVLAIDDFTEVSVASLNKLL